MVITKEESKSLFQTDWLELRELPDLGYVYSHEVRCRGKLVSILPYKITGRGLEILIRQEFIPPHFDDKELEPTTITGGLMKEKSIDQTIIEELREESGYIISQDQLVYLSMGFPSKSSDTEVYFYTCDLTNVDQTEEANTGEGGELEKLAHNEWVLYKDFLNRSDWKCLFLYINYEMLDHYLTKHEDLMSKLESLRDKLNEEGNVSDLGEVPISGIPRKKKKKKGKVQELQDLCNEISGFKDTELVVPSLDYDNTDEESMFEFILNVENYLPVGSLDKYEGTLSKYFGKGDFSRVLSDELENLTFNELQSLSQELKELIAIPQEKE